MKQCTNCGNALPDDSQFCVNCGAAVAAEPVVAAAAAEAVYEAPVAEAPATEAPAPKKKLNGKMIGLIAGGVAILAAIIFVIIGFATNWFSGPLGELEKALEKTLKADSFTITLDVSAKGSNGQNNGESSMEYQLVLDREKKDATILMTTESGESYVAKSLQADGKSYTVIISDDEVWSANMEDLPEDAYEDLFKLLNNELETDDEALEELLDQYKIKADVDEVRAFLKTLEKDCLNNQEWLEEFLGFEKKKDKFIFDIDVDDLIKDLAERAYEADIISKSQKKDWTEEKTKAKCEIEISMKDGYISELEIIMDVNDVETTYSIELSDINDTEISDKEKNAVIDEVNAYIEEYCAYCKGCNLLDKKTWLNKANDDYYCDDCYDIRSYCDRCDEFLLDTELNQKDYYDLCDTCLAEYIEENYADCVVCKTNDKKYNMYEIEKQYYCYDCRWDRDYCDNCSKFVKKDTMTRVNYNDYCADCYADYAKTHTCDLCGKVVSSNYICYDHSISGNCGNCGDHTTLNYYNVQTKKHLCYWCY